MFLGQLAAIEDHSEAPVDDLAPTHATSVVNGYPGRAPEAVPDHIVYGHVGCKSAAVIDVARFPVRRVGAADVMVIPP